MSINNIRGWLPEGGEIFQVDSLLSLEYGTQLI